MRATDRGERADDLSIRQMPAIPSQKVVYITYGGNGDMCGIPDGLLRNGSSLHNGPRQALGLRGCLQDWKDANCFHSSRRRLIIPSLHLINHNLRNIALELLSLAIPPLVRYLLMSRDQKITAGSRDQIAE